MGKPRKKVVLRRALALTGLSAVALAAPVLDLYGRNPEVFVANRAGSLQIVTFGLVVALILPVLATSALLVAEMVGGRAPDAVFGVLLAVIGLGVGAVVSRQLLPDHSVAAVAAAAAIAAGVTVLHRMVPGVFVLASLALPLVLVAFLATSDTSRLVWDQPDQAADAGRVGDPAPIVFIVLDEMPTASLMDGEGGVNRSLFPNFARLADEGTWYRNAFSNSIATTQSLPAILTGRLGERGRSPTFLDHPENLFTLLADDYEMHVIEWVTEMCPEDVCPDFAGRAPARFASLFQDLLVVYGHLALPQAARERLPGIDNSWSGFLGQAELITGTRVPVPGMPVPDAPTRSEWIDWIQRLSNGIAGNAPPTVHFTHVEAPHVPWRVNPSGTHYQRPEDYTEVEGVEGDGRWTARPEPAMLGFQRHLYQLGFVDTMLGRLFEALDRSGTWTESMVVVVADHGASFEPGEHRRWPFEDNRDDLYRVPMLIKYPGQTEGEVVDEPAFGIDILPTIVDVLRIDTDWAFDGISLLEVGGTERPHQPVFWCCSDEGASTDLTILFDQERRNHRWVPDQTSWLGVAGAGPHAHLLGHPAEDLDIEQSRQLRWSLDDESALRWEPGEGVAQTLVMGRVELPDEVGENHVLLVLNGRVAGTGYISRDAPGSGSLRGILAEDLFIEGSNQIDVLVPSPDGTSWLSGTAADLTLELVDPEGRVIEIRAQGSRRLQVSRVTSTDEGWTLEGWAADITNKLPPDRYYIFAGDSLVAHGPPNRDNRNVVAWFDSEDLLRSGFAFDVAAADLPANLEQLTVVADFDGYAVADPAWLNP